MSSNISENVAKHSGECRETFQEMPSNNSGNVGMSLKIPWNAHKGLAFKFNGRAPKHGSQFY